MKAKPFVKWVGGKGQLIKQLEALLPADFDRWENVTYIEQNCKQVVLYYNVMTQAKAVIETIEKLGGIATLNQINQHIFEIEECEWKTKTPFASVRRIVQQTNGIYKIKPGLYALESHRKQLESTTAASMEPSPVAPS